MTSHCPCPRLVFGIGFVNFTGTAWLATAAGINATASNVIATSMITDQDTLGYTVSYSFFNGLDLGAGTYYFLISSPYFDATHPLPTGYGNAFWDSFAPCAICSSARL